VVFFTCFLACFFACFRFTVVVDFTVVLAGFTFVVVAVVVLLAVVVVCVSATSGVAARQTLTASAERIVPSLFFMRTEQSKSRANSTIRTWPRQARGRSCRSRAAKGTTRRVWPGTRSPARSRG